VSVSGAALLHLKSAAAETFHEYVNHLVPEFFFKCEYYRNHKR
jgi:hypothetical protein